MIKDDNVQAQEVTDLECTEKMIKNDNVEAQEVEVSGNQGIKEELSETNKAKLGTIRSDVTKISVKEIKEVQGGDILEKMETNDKIESLLTETSKGSVCVCSVLKGKEEVVEETGEPSKVNTIKVDTVTELATEEVAGNQTEVTSCDIVEKMEVDVEDSLHKEKVQDSVSITLEDKKEIPNEDKVRKSPESGSRKGSPESRSKERSLESQNGRGPESQDKKRSPDSKGIKKCPEPQDEQKSPEDKEKGKSTLDDKTSCSPCEKSNKKIEDQDKEKDSQCRNNQGSSKVPSKADSEKDPITGCKLPINLKSDVKESNTFRQVVVLANSAYKIQLKGMENSRVKVVYEDNLSSETMIYNIIQKHRKEFGRNTLWIPLAGVYTFVNDVKVESCKNCKEPLRVIPKPSQLNDNKLLDYKILQLCQDTCDTVQYRLGSDGLITIVPPLPALLALTENYNTHQDLHDAVDGYNLIVAKTTYERMRKKYNAFCRTWIENSCERNKSWISVEVFQEYKNRGEANLFPIFSKFRYEIRLKNWFEMMEKFINLVLETTFPDMRVIESLSTSCKLDSTEVPPPPDDKVSKVVVVGSTKFTKDLQELTKDLNVEHLNENIDFDEDGLDFLNKLHNKHPSKTLCVILSGVSEVAQPVDSGPPKCKTVKCKEPIPVFVTKNDKLGDPDFKDMEINRMGNIIVKEAFDFATLALKKLKEGSNIILAPIMPMCAIWSGNDTSHSHDALHRMYKQDPNVPHFIGDSSVWIKSAKALEIKWLNKIISSVKKDSYLCELLKQYKKEIPPVLEYVEDVTVPQVKDMQKAWSEMMAKLLRYYLVGSETKAVLEPVVNPVPVEVSVTLHSQGADSEPSAVGISEVVKLLDQDQVKRVPSGESVETSPHNNAPPLVDQQTKVNRIPPGGKVPMSPHSKAPLLDHKTQVNRTPPRMREETLPHSTTPVVYYNHQSQMNRIPPGTGPDAFPHNGPPGPLDYQNQRNWIPPGTGPEGFPHNGPPGPLDHQNQRNWIPPGTGPEGFPHNGPPGPLDHQNQMNWIPPGTGPEGFPHNGPPRTSGIPTKIRMNWRPPGTGQKDSLIRAPKTQDLDHKID
ncbi:uncharacterized protein LOC135203204 [Macrobrachium nipponense]|uniref:uncharacterized protein LOC135203204 n=1 Tax=Macrobrachium nipponense TaxID=159736 RepID=UPI0030C83D7B